MFAVLTRPEISQSEGEAETGGRSDLGQSSLTAPSDQPSAENTRVKQSRKHVGSFPKSLKGILYLSNSF